MSAILVESKESNNYLLLLLMKRTEIMCGEFSLKIFNHYFLMIGIDKDL